MGSRKRDRTIIIKDEVLAKLARAFLMNLQYSIELDNGFIYNEVITLKRSLGMKIKKVIICFFAVLVSFILPIENTAHAETVNFRNC